MSRSISRIAIIMAIMKKDLNEFTRDRLWLILSVFSIVMFVILFRIVPGSVDETLRIGIHHEGMDWLIQEFATEENEGLAVIEFNSTEELKAAVVGELKLEKEISIGIDFPQDFIKKLRFKEKSTVNVYVGPGVPAEISRAMSSMVREIAFEIMGNDLPITEPDEKTIILGEDRAGNQIPLKDKMSPMLVFFLLVTETLALASLISSEIQSRTVTALRVTPARTGDVLVAKAVFGTFLAFGQALILLIAFQALDQNAVLLLTIILLASLMAAGIGMITGSSGKDFITTLFFGMLFLVPMMVPAIAVMFPGSASFWVKLLPSYGLIQGIMGITAYGKSYADLVSEIGHIITWVIIILGAGLFTLKRKVEML
jgi:ABC-2 type transport system permease protein